MTFYTFRFGERSFELDEQINCLNKAIALIKEQCDSLKITSDGECPNCSPKPKRKMNMFHGKREGDSSSAYGTGGSSSSGDTALQSPVSEEIPNIEISQPRVYHSQISDICEQPMRAQITTDPCFNCLSNRDSPRVPKNSRCTTPPSNDRYRKLSHQESSNSLCVQDRRKKVSLQPDTFYTDRENLQDTILLQQKLFLEKLKQQQGSSSETITESRVSHAKVTRQDSPMPPPRDLEDRLHPHVGTETRRWRVKKRGDGTYYVTQRPSRAQILHKREKYINEERAGVTTDDDTMSEVRVSIILNHP